MVRTESTARSGLQSSLGFNGRIGMLGTSYVGGTQHALAMAGSPYLKTVIPVDAVCNMGYASMRNGGAFEMRFGTGSCSMPVKAVELLNTQGPSRTGQASSERTKYLRLLPLRRGMTPLKLAPEYEEWLVEPCSTARTMTFGGRTISLTTRISTGHSGLLRRWLVRFVGQQHHGFLSRAQSAKAPVTDLLDYGPVDHGAQNSSRPVKSTLVVMRPFKKIRLHGGSSGSIVGSRIESILGRSS